MVKVINDIFNNRTLRKILLNLRVVIGIALLAVVAYYARKEMIPAGFAVSMFGAAIQLWSFASLVKDKELTARGPYVLVRNPMYLGRYFLILGFVMLTGNIWVVLGYTVLYYFYMYNRVRREEVRLEGLLGEPYREYCRRVNRFLPMITKLGDPMMRFFNWSVARNNHGGWNLLATLIAWGLVAWYLYRVR